MLTESCVLVQENRNANYSLKNANKVYVTKAASLKRSYQNILKKNFKTKAKRVDFKNAVDQVRQSINSWVGNRTNNKIQDLIPPGKFHYLKIQRTSEIELFSISASSNFIRWYRKRYPDGAGECHLLQGGLDNAI